MRSLWLKALFAGTLCAALLPLGSFAQGHGHGYGKDKHKFHEEDDDDRGRDHDRDGYRQGSRTSINIVFGARDREIIHDYYYRDEGRGLPPGLAKRNGNLPPGLEKQLARNGTLPPGLQKKCQPFPVELDRRLPPLPPDYSRVAIGAHILIVNRKTNVIADVAFNVFK
jgi:hypothetical protein